MKLLPSASITRIIIRLLWQITAGLILLPASSQAQLNLARLDSLGTWYPYGNGDGEWSLSTTPVTLNANCTVTASSQSNDTLAWSSNHPNFFVIGGMYTGGTIQYVNAWRQAFPQFTFTPPPDFDPSRNIFWQWRVTCGSGSGGGGTAAKPNLTCTLPPGWSDKLIISKVPGTTTNDSGFLNSDTLYVDVAALNNGNAVAPGGWKAKFYVDDVLAATWSVAGSLNPGNYYPYSDMALGPVSAGTHIIKVVLDADSNMAESNEGDNTCQKTITVGGAAAVPNLSFYTPSGWPEKMVISTVTGTNTDSTTLLNTDRLYVDISPINSGSANIYDPWVIRFYVDGEQVAERQINIALNASARIGNIIDVPIGYLTAGTHTVKAVLDAGGAITESNENDNSYERTITVGGTNGPNLTFKQPEGWPDKLLVSTMPDSYVDNADNLLNTQTLYFRAAPLNNGTSAITGSWRYRFYVDGVSIGGWIINTDLNPRQYFMDLAKEAGPLPAGSHVIKVVVDLDNEIAETNESDNVYERLITVFGVPGLPDLTGSNAYYDVAPSQLAAGGNLNLHHNIENLGDGAAGQCYVKYYLSSNTTITTADILLGSTAVPYTARLAASEDRVDANVTVPAGTAAGTYYLGWIIDQEGAVTEGNENNNTGVFPGQITITATSAPVISGQPSSATVATGQTAVFTVTAGGVPAPSYQWQYRLNSASGWSNTGANSATLTITNAQSVNAGQYQVLVTNGVSPGVTSQTATLTVNPVPAPPEIAVEFGGVPLIDGQSTAAFGVKPPGPPLEKTFMVRNMGGTSLTGVSASFSGGNAGDFSLTAPLSTTVAPGGSMSFQVQFAPQGTGARSTTLRVTSNDADENPFDILLTGTAGSSQLPVITQQPAGAALTAGDSITLRSTATGQGLTYQWYAGASGTTTVPVAGATGPSLTVTPMVNVSYWVRISNSAGFVNSSAAALTVDTTPAGQSWTAAVSATGATLWSVAWLGNQFVVVGEQGEILTSPDGQGWYPRNSGTTQQLESVAWNGREFVAVGAGGAIVSSSNAVNWTVRNSGTANEFNAVAWDGTYFWAVGAAGTIRRSNDGKTWSGLSSNNTEGYNLRYLHGTLCLTGPSTVQTSANGTAWTTRLTTAGMFYDDVTSNGATWLATGSDNMVRLSTNAGQTWTAGQTVATTWLRGAASDGTGFVVVGNAGSIYTSPNGTSWTQRTSGVTTILHAVAWNGSTYVAVGENGVILRSTGAWPGAALTSYNQWAVSRGLTGGAASGTGDWDGDGVSNVLEFFQGTAPGNAGSFTKPLPQISWDGTAWNVRYSYPQSLQSNAAILNSEMSLNAQTWTPLSTTVSADGTGFTQVRTWQATSATLNTRTFFRLRYPVNP